MFLGIDQSLTETGIVILDYDYKILLATTISTPTRGVERLFHIDLKFRELIKPFQLEFACIEGGAYKEVGRIFQLGQVSGILQLALYREGVDFIEAAPLQTKKYVQGVGKNKGKETILLDIYKNFHEEIRNDNIGDAYVLARLTRDYYNAFIVKTAKETALEKHQNEVLNIIYKSNNNNRILI